MRKTVLFPLLPVLIVAASCSSDRATPTTGEPSVEPTQPATASPTEISADPGLAGLAALRASDAAGDRNAWFQISSDTEGDPSFDLARVRDLSNAVVIGRITAVDVDRVVPGPAASYDGSFAIQHIVRYRLEVDEVVSGEVAGSDPDIVNLEVVHWAPAGQLDLLVPRSEVLAFVAWSDLVPEAWEPVAKQYGQDFVDSYRAARAEAHHLPHPGALLQVVNGQLESPLLEVILLKTDRIDAHGDPLVDTADDHSVPPVNLRTEIAATNLEDLHRMIADGPSPDMDTVRANIEARHLGGV